jgi:hypothetical protein
MSHAEYLSKPFPLVAKLASMLRNNAAVQFVVARLAGLLGSNKSSDEPHVSPFLGEVPSLDETPSLGETPDLHETPCLGETPGLGEIPSLGEIPRLELPNPGEMPSAASVELFFTAPKVFDESAKAAQSDQSERETLIRRRWAETGIKMWNPDVQGAGQAALTIQGRADLLPVKPGATRREYDRLEFKLIAGQVVCEGVAVDPPARRK